MDKVLRRLWRASFRRGLGGDGWSWLVLGGAAYLLHRSRRESTTPLETLTLSPGESVVVQVTAPRSGRRHGASV